MQTLIWAALFYSFPALVLYWEADLGWETTWIMGAFTGALLVSAFASPLAGRLIDNGYGRYLMAGSCAAGSVLLIALTFVQDLNGFYLVWLLMGLIFAAGLYDPCFSIVTRARGSNARKSITLITLFAGFASTLSYPVIVYLTKLYDWQTALLAAALVTAFFAAPLGYFSVKALEKTLSGSATKEAPRTARSSVTRQTLKTPAFWLICAGFALTALTSGSIVSHLFPILADRGIPDSMAVLVGSSIGPMQVLGRILMALFGQRLAAKALSIIATGAVGTGVLALCFVSENSLILVAVFVVSYGCGYGLISIARPDITRDSLGGSNFGTIYGMISLPSVFCAAIAPFLISFVAAGGGYGTALATAAATAFCGMLLLLFVRSARDGGPER